MLRFALIALAVLITPTAATAEARSFTHDGLERLLWVVDGRSDRSKPAPLILALHGYRKPEHALELRAKPQHLGWDKLSAIAKREGVIAVFPAASLGQWNIAPGLKNTQHADGSEIDDVAFLRSVVASFVDSGDADPTRLYLTGISDGALMSFRLLCQQDTRFAAAATLIGTAHENDISDCNPKVPPALMHVHGDNDQTLPYEGWIFKIGREVSVAEVMDHFRRLHGCTGQSGKRLDDIDPDDGSIVLRLHWTGCDTDPNVVLYKIKGGGHDVPALDADQREPPKQKINRDLDTMTEVWRFFSSAQRP